LDHSAQMSANCGSDVLCGGQGNFAQKRVRFKKAHGLLYFLFYILCYFYRYRRSLWILLGLVFSCGGDALLNINLFPFGMISFGVAHVFYISAFGWKPVKWLIGSVLFVAVSLCKFY